MGTITGLLYRKPRPLASSAANLQEHVLLGVFAVYLILGNLPRVISAEGFGNYLLLTEALLYLTAGVYALLHPRILAYVLTRFAVVYVVVLTSFLRGVVEFGFDAIPLLFSLRVIAFFFSGGVIALALKRKMRNQLRAVLDYFILVYLGVALLSLTILVVFPNSVHLWGFLSRFGVEFIGDPHRNRLVSTYLDPNFYGAVAVLPFLIGVVAFRHTGRQRYLLFTLLTLLTIVLTVSRTGLATLLAVVSVVIIQAFFNLSRRSRLRWGTVLLVPPLLLTALAASPLYLDSVIRVVERTRTVAADPSALARLRSFERGWEVFLEHPLIGIGFDYLSSSMTPMGKIAVDSSLLVLLIDFGVLATAFLGLLVSAWVLIRFRKFQLTHDLFAFDTFSLLVLYLFVAIVFTSQFNDLLFYQFWVLPMIVLFTYLNSLSKKRGAPDFDYG